MRVVALILALLSLPAITNADKKAEETIYKHWVLCDGSVTIELPNYIIEIPKTKYTKAKQSSNHYHTMIWHPIKDNGGMNISLDLYDREQLLKEYIAIKYKKKTPSYTMPTFNPDCMVDDVVVRNMNADVIIDTTYEKDGLCYSMFARKDVSRYSVRRFRGWRKATNSYLLNYKISNGNKTLSLECNVWLKHSVHDWVSVVKHIAQSVKWDGTIPEKLEAKLLILNK